MLDHACGTGQHAHAERGVDLYETPPVAVEALLRVTKDPRPLCRGPIWEPACGPGSIVRVLRAAGYPVIATDLVDYASPDQDAHGRDFLLERAAPDGCQLILTNPPFKIAGQFVEHALRLVQRVIMLVRLAFLESERRSNILDGGRLASVHVFRNRLPMMHRDGWAGPRASSAVAFAWLVWDRAHSGPAELRRISWDRT